MIRYGNSKDSSHDRPLSRALVVPVLGRVSRNPSTGHTALVRPFGSILVLPSPKEPALTIVLPSLNLGVVVVTEERLVLVGKVVTATSVPFATLSLPVGTLKSAIVPGTLVASVEPLGTVVSGQTPFRYKGPVGRLSQVLARLTSVLEVLTPAALKLGNREDLVDMVVESNVGSLRVVENAIPVGAGLESIGVDNQESRLRTGSLGSPWVSRSIVGIDGPLPDRGKVFG